MVPFLFVTPSCIVSLPCCHFSSVVYLVSLLRIWWCFHCFCHAMSLRHTLLHPALSCLAITSLSLSLVLSLLLHCHSSYIVIPLVIVTHTVTPALSLLIHCHSFSHCHPYCHSSYIVTPLVIVTCTVTPPALSLLIHCHSFSHCHRYCHSSCTVTPHTLSLL